MYQKPKILSEYLYEKSALKCSDFNYYVYSNEGCMEEFVGHGKEEVAICYENGLYS